MDGLNFSGFLQRVKDTCCASPGAAKQQAAAAAAAAADAADQDDEDGGGSAASAAAGPSSGLGGAGAADDAAFCLAFEAVTNLAVALEAVGLRSCPDVLQICAEILPELAACSRAAKLTPAMRSAGLVSGG